MKNKPISEKNHTKHGVKHGIAHNVAKHGIAHNDAHNVAKHDDNTFFDFDISIDNKLLLVPAVVIIVLLIIILVIIARNYDAERGIQGMSGGSDDDELGTILGLILGIMIITPICIVFFILYKIYKGLEYVFEKTIRPIQNIIQAIEGFIRGAVTKMTSLAVDIFKKVEKVGKDAIDGITKIGKQVVTEVEKVGSTIITEVSNVGTEVGNEVKSIGVKVGNAVTGAVNTAVSKIQSAF
jgi:uncharacterized protein YqgC (DUF456 family)